MKIQFEAKIMDSTVKQGKNGLYWKLLAVQEGELIEMYTKQDLKFTGEYQILEGELTKYKGVYGSIKITAVIEE